MSRPTFNPVPLVNAQEGWDADVNDNFDQTKEVFHDGPLPLKEYATIGALPDPTLYDRCAAIVNDGTAGWVIVISNGTSWVIVGKQAAAQIDSTAVAVAGIVADFNALLAKLRTSGVLAP